MIRKKQKARLIDDAALAIQRVKRHEPKPDSMFRSSAHLAWIRSLRCDGCGAAAPSEAAHLRIDTQTAKGEKPHDFWCWPGCDRCHRALQHTIGERSYWNGIRGVTDPNRYILDRYGLSSPCQRTCDAAAAEYERRYGAVPATARRAIREG